LISDGYEFIEPFTAGLQELSERMAKNNRASGGVGLFEAASLAAGGAICAAEQALQGDAAFALIRPPGHHASANRAWGMCYFNNMAIAIKKSDPGRRRR
jgi:acetoin utilization deacetylase AcuC-like enzyme